MPFLDRSLFDYGLSLPSDLKIKQGSEKYVLKQLGNYLPEEITRRRKFGLRYAGGAQIMPQVVAFAREILLDSSASNPFVERQAVERYLDRGLADHGSLSTVWMLVQLQCWWNEFFGVSRWQPGIAGCGN